MSTTRTAPKRGKAVKPVTGVARGSLGTATNLDDTQLYALEDLRTPAWDASGAAIQDPEPVDEPEPEAVSPVPDRPRVSAVAAARTGIRGRYLAVGGAALLGLAALLTLRDGGLDLAGGGGLGAGDAAGAVPTPAVTPAATMTPEQAGGGGGGGKGNGNNGHGNGHGH